jgi:hypothetical protein
MKDIRSEVLSNVRTYDEGRAKLNIRSVELRTEIRNLAKEHKPRFYNPSKTVVAAELLQQCKEILDDMARWQYHEKQLFSELQAELAEAKDFESEAKKDAALSLQAETRRFLTDELPAYKKLIDDLEGTVNTLRAHLKGRGGVR